MGFWSKLAKVGLIAGGGIATAMTGGAASPLLAAAIGAGTGAASGALNGGGWKGALKGAALGGATGGLGGGAGGALGKIGAGVGTGAKLGLGAAATAALKDPSLWTAGAGAVASGLAAGKQKGREAENAAAAQAATFNQQENAAKENAQMGRAGLDLQRRGFQQQSQSDAYKKAMQSAVAMHLKDVSVNRPAGVPTISFSGGLKPSTMGAEGQAAAEALNKQAMLKLMGGEQFDALPDYQGVAAPVYQKPGALENILGGVGLGANAINTAAGAAQDRTDFQKYIEAIQALGKGPPAGAPQPPPVIPGVAAPRPNEPVM